ncbi:MAG: DUF1127 domain-containing protein [Qingshengfaniella sp.]
MASYDQTLPASTPTFPGLFGRLRHALSTWYAGHQTRKQLNQLTDWELKDIGLRRDEIDAVSRRLTR